MDSRLIACSRSVHDALARGVPIVALESTLLAHGLPWPTNIETARDAEAAVRAEGAEPATIAIIDGRVHVGLEDSELERVASSGQFRKASRRDLAAVLGLGGCAATTVSGTLAIAQGLGFSVMATGGIGGVHRGAAATMDISADLDALARADGVLLVCSGAKSLLDLRATLEALETRGVLVLGYQTNELPAFTAVSSGLRLDWRVDTPQAAAAVWRAHQQLKLPGAIVLAQSVLEAVAVEAALMERAIDEAHAEARRAGVAGAALTPFLLEQVRARTGGRSLMANRTLIVENARLAARVALAR